MKHLALDGPFNGHYLTPEQATKNGYTLIDWSAVPNHVTNKTERESVFVHSSSEHVDEEHNFDPEPELHPETAKVIKLVVLTGDLH